MKPNELMIGDWVTHNDGTPMQVSVVKQDCFACSSQPHLYDYNNEFSPIPITPGILKANGFKQEPNGDYVRGDGVHDIEQVYISVSFRRDKTARVIAIRSASYSFFTDRIPHGYFVHELQHALRLCGLSDLADNFKVV